MISLDSRELSAGDQFSWPFELLSLGGYLVVTDRPWAEGAVHVVDAQSGDLVLDIGRKGEGPGEYVAVPDALLSPGSQSGEFWLYDRGLRRLTKVALEEAPKERFDRAEIFRVPSTERVYEVGFLNDSLILLLGYFDDGRVRIWSRSTSNMQVMGPLPPGDPSTSPIVLQDAYQGKMAIRPGGHWFAVGTEKGGRIELFSLEKGWMGLAEVPFSWEPDYVPQQYGNDLYAEEGYKNRAGYLDLDATEDRLYALFSGRSEFWFRGDMDLGEWVHEFDWEGRFLRAFHLDRPVERFEVDGGHGKIFGTVQSPTPGVVVFDLPQDIDGAPGNRLE